MRRERDTRGALDPDGCEALVAAVILRAARDYVNALRRLRKNKNNATALAEVKKLRRFFASRYYERYFGGICDFDGEYLLDRIELEFEESGGKYHVGQLYHSALSFKDEDL